MSKTYKVRAGAAANIWIPETRELILAGEENTVPVPEEAMIRGRDAGLLEVLGEWPAEAVAVAAVTPEVTVAKKTHKKEIEQ
jgi:hypothetical protein